MCRHPNSTNSRVLNQGGKRSEIDICDIDGDTLFWYDLDEANLDGKAIPLETHADHGTTFH